MKLFMLAGTCVLAAAAQVFTEPPPLIRVVRRAGVDPAAIRPYAQGRAAAHVFGMVAIAGPSETWLLEAHGSFTGIEDVDRAVRAGSPPRLREDVFADDLQALSGTFVAIYRPGLSYRPEQAIRMFGKARYFYATVYRVPAGGRHDFYDTVRARRAGLDSINLDRPDIAYQIIAGAPSGMYVFLAPLTSLATLDEALARTPLGGEVFGPRPAKAPPPEAEIGREHMLFRLEPGMSYVSDEFAAADPEFWRRK